MKPVSRLDHNFTYTGPEDVGDLPCRVNESETFSHWRPDEDEIAMLNDGGVVELIITGHPIPPVHVQAVPADQPEVDAPFKREWPSAS